MDMLLLVIIGSELMLDRKNHIIINIKIIYIVGNEFASQSLPSGERQEPLINPREHR
ncbi:hypothetical protein XNC1_3738 [Xenorhabdus nematophila ATCC 19061]|uniref:Uncharacterized protein n=1 Tax=Xenorhabdus nematophila (strain ATCC 19061 / DSM 3370 / CCUG 14189 / LMG 1036 / NCIMB 9965 / AN6) TaxID=406817 RepID=D3VAZ4_XENNA|nr:hypothetical protein [Xenorhabdus nematophila]CBJ91769.1 hypothetical protein XNC1_3738 [Xenorhabdus nematophila ATCC 19061]CEK24587.1 hypothetical protein XNC2_3593 [Xenorhabdus nematophila AN6/1]